MGVRRMWNEVSGEGVEAAPAAVYARQREKTVSRISFYVLKYLNSAVRLVRYIDKVIIVDENTGRGPEISE